VASIRSVALYPVDEALASMFRVDGLESLRARSTDQTRGEAGLGHQLERRRDWRTIFLECGNAVMLLAFSAHFAVVVGLHFP